MNDAELRAAHVRRDPPDALDQAIEYYSKHEPSSCGLAFVHDATISVTLAFLRELKMRRIQMHRLALEFDGRNKA